MVDNEHVRQQREIGGEALRFCDRCGKPINSTGAGLIEREQSTEALVTEEIWLCADCRQEIEKGEVEAEIGSELGEPE